MNRSSHLLSQSSSKLKDTRPTSNRRPPLMPPLLRNPATFRESNRKAPSVWWFPERMYDPVHCQPTSLLLQVEPAKVKGWIWLCPLLCSHLAYTGCSRRNGQNFGRVLLMLNYTDIIQNTYIQSWTVTEIMAREKCGHLAFPRTVRLQLCHALTLTVQ